MMNDLFGLIENQLAYDEPDPDDLPDDLDVLLAIHDKLNAVRAAALVVRQTVDTKIGGLLGPGVKHEYGESIVSWRHNYRWKPIIKAITPFITQVVGKDPEATLMLFPVTAIRKTGVEKAARILGVDPDAAVETVLEKVWDDHPSVQFKPKGM
jgi:hypothetical protein